MVRPIIQSHFMFYLGLVSWQSRSSFPADCLLAFDFPVLTIQLTFLLFLLLF